MSQLLSLVNAHMIMRPCQMKIAMLKLSQRQSNLVTPVNALRSTNGHQANPPAVSRAAMVGSISLPRV